ncbi:MAG: hypothetical protein V2B14_06970 [bacterium]
MKNLNKKLAVEIVLEKRFGIKDPDKIKDIIEINIVKSLDKEENPLGIGVELILNDENGNKIKEEYQVSNKGVVYSWGNTPVIDKESQKQSIIND